jgi:prenylcysteine oxidase / farnesylcysteine lyase
MVKWSTMRSMKVIPLLLCSSSLCLARRVAVIGGGISGSFVAKYLSDYDKGSCALTSVTIFDPFPMGEPTTTTPLDDWQGSRVASTILSDGSVVELGASVFYSGFRLIVDMIKGDPALEIGEAFNTGKKATRPEGLRTGLGIYGGAGLWHFSTANTPSVMNKLKMLWRYNIDIYYITSATNRVERSFALIHQLLESTHISTFYKSPDSMWEDVGLMKPAHMSFDDFLDLLGLSRELSWWRKYLPYQGVLRDELMTAINLCNYNQGNSQVNGIVGLGSFVSAKVALLSIVGGNQKVIKSSLQQAQETHRQYCKKEQAIQHVQQRVTTVVGDLNTMELFSNEQSLGEFEVVVLAAPMQQARVEFLVKSVMDSAVVLPMPFNLLDPETTEPPEDGHPLMPHPLPDVATRPYTQVVTTLVSQADLNATRFGLSTKALPRGIYTTEAGKAAESNITAIAQITPEGAYKVFSSEKLSDALLHELFGPNHKVEFVKVWGGNHGGATPDYRGQGMTMDYLLFDSGVGLKGGVVEGSALYYVNAIEGAMACMELSAIGAKSVAKLVAKRLGLIESWEHDAGAMKEEL